MGFGILFSRNKLKAKAKKAEIEKLETMGKKGKRKRKS